MVGEVFCFLNEFYTSWAGTQCLHGVEKLIYMQTKHPSSFSVANFNCPILHLVFLSPGWIGFLKQQLRPRGLCKAWGGKKIFKKPQAGPLILGHMIENVYPGLLPLCALLFWGMIGLYAVLCKGMGYSTQKPHWDT